VRTVYASVQCDATVHEAETCWCATERWPAWVDGLESIESLDPTWPRPDATVVWQSTPAGRGRVSEQVTAREPLEILQTEVDDDTINGTQTVTFTPAQADAVMVTLTLSYRLKRRSPLMPIVDLLFIRSAMQRSLRQTLARFAVELAAAHGARDR
jgi:uncharacterized membrane protein